MFSEIICLVNVINNSNYYIILTKHLIDIISLNSI